jgi:hypothetical protein
LPSKALETAGLIFFLQEGFESQCTAGKKEKVTRLEDIKISKHRRTNGILSPDERQVRFI